MRFSTQRIAIVVCFYTFAAFAACGTENAEHASAPEPKPVPPAAPESAPTPVPASVLPDPTEANKRIAEAKVPTGTLTPESFWHMRLKTMPTAWSNLTPWAFWAVANLQPDVLVELGTHAGHSFFAFDQAISTLGLKTRSFAVDTWLGDKHAGFYDESVYDLVNSCNQKNYASFSTLVRATFDEAAPQFADGSIDLLHIDGRHTYNDVSHDFEMWLPKMSSRGVIMFHDVMVQVSDFGVYKFWAEVTEKYPHFTFRQGPGLGILGVGAQLPAAAQALFATTGTSDEGRLQSIYNQLGEDAMNWSAPGNCEE